VWLTVCLHGCLYAQEFFELALEEVVQSYDTMLDDMSPVVAQGLRSSARHLKEVRDYQNFAFQRLDASLRSSIRKKFMHHRLVEVQQTFEKLVVARNANERQLAFEASIFLFRLADESAESKANASKTDAHTAATGGEENVSNK
jgi:hypothetical protein